MTDLRDQLAASLGAAYTLEHELGGGGMSRVFVAQDHALRRRVVVKVLPPELTAGVNVERFSREILLAAKLQHPHIVPVHSTGEMNGLPWFTMPFVEGESLRARLARTGRLSITESVGILRDVARALAYAHDHGIVHRDIKPDNILLTGGSATVADFGIAKAISAARTAGGLETLTQVGTSIGTPAYMSPEQAAGDPETDHRADVYSFGCVAYEILAGRPPFVEHSPRKLLAAHMGSAAQPIAELRPDTPAVLADLVMRCLAKEPEGRPGSASDLVRVLETVTTGEGTQPALPGILLGGASMMWKALGIYAVSFGAVAILARAAIVGIGLPEWVFPGALIVMALGLPVVLWTGYVHRVARKAFATTPTITPGGTPSYVKGTMATMALKASPHMSWRRTARGGAIALVAFVVLVGGYMTLRALGIGPAGSLFASGALKRSDRIVMDDFSVSGADSSLGRVVSDAVRAGLTQSNALRIVPLDEVSAELQRMERPRNAHLGLGLARELAQREGAKAVVDGNVTKVGTSYIVSVSLVTADSGRELWSDRLSAAGPNAIIGVADRLARELRSKSGESLRAVNAAPPLAQATTSSLEALKLYSEANRANQANDPLRAVQLARQAVSIDTAFAEAWRLLGVAATNARMPRSVSDSALARAYQLRDRVSGARRDAIAAMFYQSGPGRNRGLAIQAYERAIAAGDSGWSGNLALLLGSRRQFARAESLTLIKAREPKPSLQTLGNLVADLRLEGKWAEVDSLRRVMKQRFPNSVPLRMQDINFQIFAGDTAAFWRSLDSARKSPNRANPAWALETTADMDASFGRLRESMRLFRQAWRIDSTVGRPAPAVLDAVAALDLRLVAGLPPGTAVRALDAELAKTPLSSFSPVDAPWFPVAIAYARAHRVDRARAILAQYGAAVTDTNLLRAQRPGVDRVLGYIALAEGKWAEAARRMRAGDSLPDGPANACAFCLPLQLVQVFAEAGMADSALAQWDAYKRTPIISRPLVGPDLQVDALTIDAVAKMYDQRGDTAHAVEAYRDFIARWQNADPELQPRVQEARKRLRALTPVEQGAR